MSDGPLHVHDDGAVRVFTLDVPERRNALTVPLRRELRAALEAVEETMQVGMFETEDFAEGRAALLEKPSAEFRGR